MAAASVACFALLLALGLAGCSGGGTVEPSVAPPMSSIPMLPDPIAKEPELLAPEERFNETFTFQPTASLASRGFNLDKAWIVVNATAKLQNTATCYTLMQEVSGDGTVYSPSVTLVSPSGIEHTFDLVAALGCEPASPPSFLKPVSTQVDAEIGFWVIAPHGRGMNMDLRIVVVAE